MAGACLWKDPGPGWTCDEAAAMQAHAQCHLQNLSPGWRRRAQKLCEVQRGLQLSLLHIFYEDTKEKGWLYPISAGCSEKTGLPSYTQERVSDFTERKGPRQLPEESLHTLMYKKGEARWRVPTKATVVHHPQLSATFWKLFSSCPDRPTDRPVF